MGLVIVLAGATPATAGRRSTRCCLTFQPGTTPTGVQHYCFVVRTARKSRVRAAAVCRAIGGVPGRRPR